MSRAPSRTLGLVGMGCLLALLDGCSAPASPVVYPKTFIGLPANSSTVTVFDSATGRPNHQLVDNARGAFAAPAVGAALFWQNSTNDGCGTDVWRVGLSGGAATKLMTVPGLLSAVSPDGRLIVYVDVLCSGTDPETGLTVTDVSSGNAHTLNGNVTGENVAAALSPDDHRLAVVTRTAPYSLQRILTFPNVLSATSISEGSPVPCPSTLNPCGQIEPTFDAGGTLFYVATTAPDGARPLRVWDLAITRVRDGHATALVSLRSGDGEAASLSVNGSDDALLFTVLDVGGQHWTTYRSVGGSLKALPVTVFDAGWGSAHG